MRCLSMPRTGHVCLVVVSIVAQLSVAQDLFDCEAGDASGWSNAKKDWCCKNKNQGCEDVAINAAASSDDGVGGGVAEGASASGSSATAASGFGTAPAPPPKPPVPPTQPATPPVEAAARRTSASWTVTTTTTTISEASSKAAAAASSAAASEAQRQAAQAALNQELRTAALKDKDLAQVQSLIAQRADINSKSGDGNILYSAAMWKDADYSVKSYIASLVALRADMNMADARGRTPLFNAAVHAQNLHLIDAFKDATNKNPHRAYAVNSLQLSVREGREDIVKALLDLRADPDVKDARGGTAKGECEEHKLPNSMRALLGMPPAETTTTTTPLVARRMFGDL